jgi:hypothetical protein
MTQNTQSKFAAILAAAQEKANIKTTPTFKAPDAVKSIEPQAPVQELSSFTIEEILTGCEPAEDESQAIELTKISLKIVDYSDRAFAIVSEEKPSEDVLNILRQYGTFNKFLKCGKGWIFSKRHLNTVKAQLSL